MVSDGSSRECDGRGDSKLLAWCVPVHRECFDGFIIAHFSGYRINVTKENTLCSFDAYFRRTIALRVIC